MINLLNRQLLIVIAVAVLNEVKMDDKDRLNLLNKDINKDIDEAEKFIEKFPHSQSGHWMVIIFMVINFLLHVGTVIFFLYLIARLANKL